MSGNTRQSRAQVDATFVTLLTTMRDHAEALLNAATSGGAPKWFVPGEFQDSLINPVTLAGPGPDAGGKFSRKAVNAQYESMVASYTEAGTTGDIISLKLQNDYVAMMERAWRIRHATPLRSHALSIARDFGQARGPIFTSNQGGIAATASDFIAAGSSGSDTLNQTGGTA